MRRLMVVWLLSLVALWNPHANAESEPTKAINFHFTDISGKSLRLSDFRGKWVLVNFWAPWCPLCWVEVPALNQLNKRKDFVVIGIGLDYGPDQNIVRDAAMRHNLDYYAIVAGGARRNPDSPFRQVGPVDFYPTSYLYDPNGEIVMFIPGQVQLDKIHAFMAAWAEKKTQYAGKVSASASEAVKKVSYTRLVADKTGTGGGFNHTGQATAY
jgi:thiol-disulfide isomerase/thioredoxin